VALTREELQEVQKHRQRVKEPDAPLTPQQEQLLKLQSGVGNAALARALLNRQLPDLVPRIQPPQPMDGAIRMPVVAYLERMRVAIQLHNEEGTISMPELVNWVRQNVPESLTATPFQIEMVITETLAGDTPPPTRKQTSPDGRAAEVESRILNSLPKPPKELKIHAGPGTLTFGFSGDATLKVGAVTAQANKDGGSVTVKDGDTSVTGSGSFHGDAFGLKANVNGLGFEAQVRKDGGTKEWSKFNAPVKIPIVGNETVEGRPPNEEISETVMAAESAIEDVIAYIAQGGSPTDEIVRTKMAAIKPALEKVTKATEARKGPQGSVQVTVGTGDPKLGSYGVVSLVIEF
jgi:hypothetical protein